MRSGEGICAFLGSIYVLCVPARVKTINDMLAESFRRVAGKELHRGTTKVTAVPVIWDLQGSQTTGAFQCGGRGGSKPSWHGMNWGPLQGRHQCGPCSVLPQLSIGSARRTTSRVPQCCENCTSWKEQERSYSLSGRRTLRLPSTSGPMRRAKTISSNRTKGRSKAIRQWH